MDRLDEPVKPLRVWSGQEHGQPDLIIGTNSGMKQADYTKLSALAPTIPGVKGSTDYFSPWDQQTVQVAKALGQEAAGGDLRGEPVKDRYRRAGDCH